MPEQTATPQLMFSRRLSPTIQVLLVVGVVALTALIDWLMGRLFISKSGRIMLWVGDIHSSELSQQLFDWYSLSHVLHGFIFYWVIRMVSGGKWPRVVAFGIAIAIEGAWEILENTPMVIDRYRDATAAQGYTGDTILNSVFDIISCALGYIAARHFPVWVTLTLLIVIEVGLAIAIRDNLTLNVLMLIYPIEAIKQWQMGA